MSKKYDYEYIKNYIESFGYKLLSKTYANNATKLKMICNNGHECEISFANFKNKNETIDMWIQKECAWLDADLTKDEANSKTRWVICYMHLSPFTCVRSDWVQRFVPIFEKHRVHMVLCG